MPDLSLVLSKWKHEGVLQCDSDKAAQLVAGMREPRSLPTTLRQPCKASLARHIIRCLFSFLSHVCNFLILLWFEVLHTF